MQKTKNLQLKKPDYTDVADIANINDNMDVIDENIAQIGNTLDEKANKEELAKEIETQSIRNVKKIHGQPIAGCIYPTGGVIDFYNESGAVSIFGANGDEFSVGGEGINANSDSEIILRTPLGLIWLNNNGTLHLIPDGMLKIKDNVTISDNEFNVSGIDFRPDEIVGHKDGNNEKISVLRNFLKVNGDYINAGVELTEGGTLLKEKYAAKNHSHEESVRYARCTTLGSEQDKKINIQDFTLNDEVPTFFVVVFANDDDCISGPTMSVNNLGRYDICYKGYPIKSGQLRKDIHYPLMFNGVNFELVGNWEGIIETD